MSNRLPLCINRPLLARLEREWSAITARPAVVRRAQGWGLGVPYSNLDELLVAIGHRELAPRQLAPRQRPQPAAAQPAAAQPAAAPSADAVLGRLLLAARGDEVAARVVLQRLLPGLISGSRRWGVYREGGSADAFDELLSAAWMVIREFPVERHTHQLVARMLRESEYRAFGRALRRRLVHELVEPQLLDLVAQEVARAEPLFELVDIIAAAGSLDERDRQLLVLLAQGRSQSDLAQLFDVSERTVRNHRDAMVHRVRSLVLAA